MNKEILVFTPPFAGHANILKEFAAKYGEQYRMELVVTGWNNIRPDLSGLSVPHTILARSDLRETDPALWTLPRANELLPDALAIIEDRRPDLVVSDFFSWEGTLAARLLDVPYWTSVPALMGPFVNQEYMRGKLSQEVNVDAIAQLRKNFGIEIDRSAIEMISDGIHFPGQHNLVWTYDPVIPPDFMRNRQLLPYNLVGHLRAERPVVKEKTGETPTVYISFGTVVMDNLWNQQPETREQLKGFIGALAKRWEGQNVRVVFVTQGKEVLTSYPDNWEVNDRVDQVGQLSRTTVFVTHGGNNSFQEALVQKVPVVVIPFFGDQILVGRRAEALGVGINLGRDDDIDTKKSKAFLTDHLAEEVDQTVHRILTDSRFRESYDALHLMAVSLHALLKSTVYLKDPREIIVEELPAPTAVVPMKRGDVLYGTTDARVVYEARAGIHSKLQFWKFRPFSEIAPGAGDLPGIVDIYHDSLRDKAFLETDLKSGMTEYKQVLQAYRTFLGGERDICRMCVKGLDFFSQLYGVQFLVDRYEPEHNYITTREIAHVLKNEDRFAATTKFYREETGGWHEVPYGDVREQMTGISGGEAIEQLLLGIEDGTNLRELLAQGVFVASASPIKYAASVSALGEEFADVDVNVEGLMPAVKMNEQLVGIEETVFEVTNRLLSLRKELEEKQLPYGLLISTCNGIVQEDGKWKDVGIVMMTDANGKTAIAKSEGVVFPDHYVEEAKRRGFSVTTVGSVIAEASGGSAVNIDPHTYLTDGRLTRTGLLAQAIRVALSQLKQM